MRSSEFLYGNLDMTELRTIPHESALWRKIHASQELVESLSNEPLETRDMFRINKSLESQKHNKALIAELYGKDIQ